MPISFEGRSDFDGGHSSGGCRLDAHVGVFEDETVLGLDTKAGSGDEIAIGSGLSVLVVLGADDGLESVHQAEGGKGI